nr:hypothetical protein [Paraburkholderia sp. ZP32-5]
MRAVLGAFVLIATFAVHSRLASHLDAGRAALLTLAVAALLALCAARYDAAQPRVLQIGRDGLSVWNEAGVLLAQGSIVGCAQWSGLLLSLALQPEGRRTGTRLTGFRARVHTVLLPADALPAPVFRELSVLGRRAAGA